MDSLAHTGTPHEGMIPHSGRYPYGSGEKPNQHPKTWLDFDRKYVEEGFTEKERAEAFGLSIRQYQAKKSVEKAAERESIRDEVLRMKRAGLSNSEIGRRLGKNESSIRGYLDESVAERQSISKETAEFLKKELKNSKYLDVGAGVPELLGISSTRLTNAVQILKDEGYEVHKVKVPQASDPSKKTTVMALCPPGTTWREVKDNISDIGIVNERYVDPQGRSKLGLEPIKSISSKRIQVAYREDGGEKKDGIIELRRGVEGLSLGNARYAQVRIGVDGTHFLKGMAIYADDLPDGVDIRFNTNKSKDDPKYANKLDVFKPMKRTLDGEIDQDNPFGSAIKPGGQMGYVNLVRAEGDWSKWSKTLASQMLSKQSVALAKQQLSLAQEMRKQEYDEILSLTNPVVKKHLLEQYADNCDKAAEHLKAAAMSRQGSHVILPLNTIAPNQIYAPNYKTGEKVVLIRYPHGGTFEIPELTVNNNNKEAQRLFRQAQDAVGIHHTVAERLSGADFDGDTVVVIPNNNRRITNSAPLKGLEGFDPKQAYPERKGMTYMTKDGTQRHMGVVSNLITDMTLQDAPPEHIARAVRHSMVVIDAEKHKLDYKQSEKDNGIDELKRIYQQNPEKKSSKKYGGASTLISRAKSEVYVPQREEIPGERGIDPKTGRKLYKLTGATNWKGEPAQSRSTQMKETTDARTLMSKGKPIAMEMVYANHANTMKAMANEARKEILRTPDPVRSPEAAKKYAPEVASITTKVNNAAKAQPYERKAQILAKTYTDMKLADYPSMSKEDLKKVRTQSITEARARLNSKRPAVSFTAKEWEAIQNNAISKTMLKKALRYADQDAVKQLALPREQKGLTDAKLRVAKLMAARGYTQAEIAQRIGVSTSTVSRALNA